MNNRGVKDVFVFCVDGLTGFPDAIKGVFPKSDIQLCIVHLVRSSLKYVFSYKYRKELSRNLKEIYHAGTLEGAEAALLRLDESALKMVWIAVSNASQKWTMLISNWSKA